MRNVEDIWCESVGRDYKFNLKPVHELEEGWQGLMWARGGMAGTHATLLFQFSQIYHTLTRLFTLLEN